jgi:hypothetical protein
MSNHSIDYIDDERREWAHAWRMQEALQRIAALESEVAAVRTMHNGYDPEARKAMPTLREPASLADAVRDLIDEERTVAMEIAAKTCDAVAEDERIYDPRPSAFGQLRVRPSWAWRCAQRIRRLGARTSTEPTEGP